jgi:hypothetical protein
LDSIHDPIQGHPNPLLVMEDSPSAVFINPLLGEQEAAEREKQKK